MSTQVVDIRAIYGGASGSGHFNGAGAGAGLAGGPDSNAMKSAGAGGPNVLDMVGAGVVAGGTALAFGKKVLNFAKKPFMPKVPKAVGLADDAAKVVSRSANALDDVVKAGGKVGRMAALGSKLDVGARALGKVALPLTVISSAVEVTAGDLRVEEGGWADRTLEGVREGDRAGKFGPFGVYARAQGEGATVGIAAAEETLKSIGTAASTVLSSEASIWDKAGAVLDVGAAPIRGALMGGKAVVEGRVDDHYRQKAADSNAGGKAELQAVFNEKMAAMTPAQQAILARNYPEFVAPKQPGTEGTIQPRAEKALAQFTELPPRPATTFRGPAENRERQSRTALENG